MIRTCTPRGIIPPIATYDLEWVPGTLRLRLAGFFDGDRYHRFTSARDLLTEMLKPSRSGSWYYAHFGGMTDFQFLLEELIDAPEYSVSASFSGASAIIVKVRRGKRNWTFIDSFWLFRDSLARIGTSVGMEKGGPETTLDDDAKKRWFATAPIAELATYNEQDCRILHKAILRFAETLAAMGSDLTYTIAGCALKLFRSAFLKEDIDTQPRINEPAALAYVGSRVEVIQKHVTDSLYYDINSSFPHSMMAPQPGAYLGSSRRLPTKEGVLYLADVDIEVPECHLPPLPARIKDRIFFPTGRWSTHLTNPDIDLLLKHGGRIRKVRQVWTFEPFHDLSAYVATVYEARKRAKDPFEKIVYKYLLNSLYGKFAEGTEKTRLVVHPSDEWTTENRAAIHSGEIDTSSLPPHCYLVTQTKPVAHRWVMISAHITAQSRAALYEWTMLGGGEPHYLDTDGFSIKAKLPTTSDLGGLKLEKRIDRAHFIAPKVYEIEGTELQPDGTWKRVHMVKAKGFSRLTVDGFAKLAKGEAVTFPRMQRIRERLRQGETSPAEVVIEKRMRMPHAGEKWNPARHAMPKRHFYRSGKSRPFTVGEVKELLRVL